MAEEERARKINSYMVQLYAKRMRLADAGDNLIWQLNRAQSWKYAIRKTCVTIEDYMMPFFWKLMTDSIKDYYTANMKT